MAVILDDLTATNGVTTRIRLLHFPRRCLRVPLRGGRRWSLVRQVNHQLTEEYDPPPSLTGPSHTLDHQADPLQSLASRVSTKLEDGDFRGAVRLTWSENSVAEANEATINCSPQNETPCSNHHPLVHSTCDKRLGDIPCVHKTYDTLLDSATDPRSHARLLVLGVARKESGAWLNNLSISSLGL